MIVGIDLGTTHSLVAVWDAGAARLLPNALGEVLTPSCVSLDEDGTVLVGRAAKERLQTHPDRTAAAFKRYMGTSKSFRLGDRDFRPEELSSCVLRSLKADAESALGMPIEEAIITVPAYFSDAQRKATRLAGKLAGLKVERLLNEPTAAALAYGVNQRHGESRFLVFDLGGGTFDISILELFEGVMEVRATAGDNLLGGDDFTEALVELFLERLQCGQDDRQDPRFMQSLIAQMESAKRALSSTAAATVTVTVRGNDRSLDLDGALVEKTCAHLLRRLRAPVERALRDANLHSDALDGIVLAGGATRMPAVRKLATLMFGRFPESDINPDEVVALGAAVQAGLRMRDAALREVVMTDVAPYSLGVEVAEHVSGGVFAPGHFDPIIVRNTIVPVSRTKTYAPLRNGSREIELKVYQGEARLVKDNIHLGVLKVPLAESGADENGVDVRFTYDANGLLDVDVVVRQTGEKRRLVIEGHPGALDAEGLERSLAAMAALKIHPRDAIVHRTLLARAERMFQQVSGDARSEIGQRIRIFEHALEVQDAVAIDAEGRNLTECLQRIERDGRTHDGSPFE
jgi:molecular chaperone HscC